MYRGFQLDLRGENPEQYTFITELLNFSNQGKALKEANESIIKKTLDSFRLSDGSIDGSKMQANWFPQIKADVFISHSHQDKELALGLAGWLHEHFGLKAFIDSAVWGHSQDLEGMLLKNYQQYSPSTNTDELKNFTSAHVHMMLFGALEQMIDNTECLFFMNTPNSISHNVPIEGTTPSPWIYLELKIFNSIRTRFLEEHRGKQFKGKMANEALELIVVPPIRHSAPINHLVKLSPNNLLKWESRYQQLSCLLDNALDCLYNM
jgi:hypothetical protein